MHRRLRALVPLVMLGAAIPAAAQDTLRVASPDGKNVVTVGVREGGLYYAVRRNGTHVLLPSRLGFAFRGTFLIDRDGVVQFLERNGPGDARDQQGWRDALKDLSRPGLAFPSSHAHTDAWVSTRRVA